MALQCFRKALETDSRCICALYKSMLIYRQLENTQAEIQALRLLHSVGNIQYICTYVHPPQFGSVHMYIYICSNGENCILSVATLVRVMVY